MKGMTMGVAVSAMGINMILQGSPKGTEGLGIFLFITVLMLIMAVILLKNVKGDTA